MRHSPPSVRVALLLLALDALLWFGFGVVVACGGIASINHPPVLRWGMVGLAWVSAASLAGIALLRPPPHPRRGGVGRPGRVARERAPAGFVFEGRGMVSAPARRPGRRDN